MCKKAKTFCQSYHTVVRVYTMPGENKLGSFVFSKNIVISKIQCGYFRYAFFRKISLIILSSRHLKGMYETDSHLWLKIAIGMAVFTGIGFGVYKYAKSR